MHFLLHYWMLLQFEEHFYFLQNRLIFQLLPFQFLWNDAAAKHTFPGFQQPHIHDATKAEYGNLLKWIDLNCQTIYLNDYLYHLKELGYGERNQKRDYFKDIVMELVLLPNKPNTYLITNDIFFISKIPNVISTEYFLDFQKTYPLSNIKETMLKWNYRGLSIDSELL